MHLVSCFINKNTPEIRKELERLGYRHSYKRVKNLDKHPCLISFKDGDFTTRINKPLIFNDYIDCTDNEPLFFALAALRDDTDYMQWFTDGKEWELCERQDWDDMFSVLCCGKREKTKEHMDYLSTFHKATKDELIKHFTKGEER